MTVTGTNNEQTPDESNTNTQANETPISQRGSGQNVLFTTPAQPAAAQVDTTLTVIAPNNILLLMEQDLEMETVETLVLATPAQVLVT